MNNLQEYISESQKKIEIEIEHVSCILLYELSININLIIFHILN